MKKKLTKKQIKALQYREKIDPEFFACYECGFCLCCDCQCKKKNQLCDDNVPGCTCNQSASVSQ